MCTTAATRINDSWFLLKTRDPVEWMRWDDEIKLFNTAADRFRKLIIQNPDPNQDGYYGGINDQGVAYVSTYVHVAENQISYIRRPYVRLILDAASAKEAVEIIQSFNPRIGGNMFIADQHQCFGIEAVPETYHIEKVEEPSAKTNHFLSVPHVDLKSDEFLSWSKTHYSRAQELISTVRSLENMKALLQDREYADKKEAICTTKDEDDCFTYSAFIFDTGKIEVHYAQGNPLEVPFKKYGFR